MAFPDDIFFASASDLLTMLRSRQVSAAELVSAFIERVESLNPHVKSVVTLCEERAAVEADEADHRLSGREDARPLEGLPITIKDSIETKGIRSTDGMKILEHHIPQEDAPAVARLRAAGAIIIGKTNVPEMAMDYDCDNPLFGSTNNPWNSTRVPGGSSGGEAASLASGMCALGLGSDYGGSIRIPAHFCGIVGLKPSWGTIPGTGHLPPSPGAPPPIAHMATIGPMARYVDDLTLKYNLISGPHPSTPYTVPSLEAHPENVDLKQLECAFFTDVEAAVPVAAEIRAAIERAAKALDGIGVRIEQKTPPVKEAARIWADYAMADGGELLRAQLGERINLSRERLRNAFTAPTPSKSAAEFFRTSIERDIYRVQLARFMERYPIVIGAPFCVTAFEHGGIEVNVDGQKYPLFTANWPALWVNCAGLPAAVVPAGHDRAGLPIGVQIVGRAFEEETVLAVAKALEQELGGFKKPPLPH
ncbi:MAG TPA: amidase [Candidatus Binataceae bacterium]|nr:amidase [Candidatus Binataceae bacterium]